MVGDMGGAMTAALMLIGDKLGLYKELAAGKLTSAELAKKTGTTERYVREWLAAQAAAGYVDYDPKDGGRYSLSPEQAMAFANDDSPVFMPGFADVIQSMWRDEPKITQAFKSGKGVGWHGNDPCRLRGTERFFRPGYAANLVGTWLPALEGVVEKLKRGARIADVGCGHGASTIIMAKAFPNSEFIAYDYHQPSVEKAAKAAKDA